MKTLFISWDGIDGSGKGWAVKHLAEKLRADGLEVWADTPRNLLGSCRLVTEDLADDFIARFMRVKEIMSKAYDVVLFDRSSVTLMASWGFWKKWREPETLWEMLKNTFCDLNIVLQPPFELCCERVQKSASPESNMAKTNDYMESFKATMEQTVNFLKPRLGNRFIVFDDNEVAVDWAYQMVRRLNTHFDLHLTNACPLKCPTCCFGAGEGNLMEAAIDGRWYEIVDAGFTAGINEFHLMGGEPLILGQKLVDLMKYIRDKGGRTHLLTSGYDLKYADELLPLADAVFVSLDGPRETHNFTRGKDIFGNACEFIRKADQYGCKIRIGTVVSKLNVKTAHKVVDVVQQLGVTPRSLCWMNMSPTGGLFSVTHGKQEISSDALDNYLSAEEWLEFVDRISNDEKIRSLPWAKIEPAFSNRPEDFGCEMLQGKRRVMVMSDGSMYLCPMLTPLPSKYNILNGDSVGAMIKLLSWTPEPDDPCQNGCQGGCIGYAKLFGNGICDARCGKQVESKIPEKFRLSEDRIAQGYRPVCPCRTVKIAHLKT